MCEHNAGHSQMAAAFANQLSNGWVGARSAGSHPEEQIDPVVVDAMRELVVDVTVEFPKPPGIHYSLFHRVWNLLETLAPANALIAIRGPSKDQP